jgi:hypothetical protein
MYCYIVKIILKYKLTVFVLVACTSGSAIKLDLTFLCCVAWFICLYSVWWDSELQVCWQNIGTCDHV